MSFTTCNNCIVSTVFSKLHLFGFNFNSDVLLDRIFVLLFQKKTSGVLTATVNFLLKRDKVIRTYVSRSKEQKVKGLFLYRYSYCLTDVKHVTSQS